MCNRTNHSHLDHHILRRVTQKVLPLSKAAQYNIILLPNSVMSSPENHIHIFVSQIRV